MSTHTPAPDAAWPSAGRAWWTVAVLVFAYVISFVDRTILSLLIEPIKASLHLSDTEIGLVQGLAFGLFYAAMGLPLGWLADRMSRRSLIAIGATLWCFATAACGLATSFVQLFLARIGVGVGEASLGPSALSLISDSFPRERRGLPIAIYAAAAAAGAGLALMVGGAVIQMVATHDQLVLPLIGAIERWQAAFLLVGVAGLVIAPLMATVREPARRTEVATAAPTESIAAFVRRNSAFMVRHYVAVACFSILIYAALSWVPTQFVRVYGWTAGEVGWRYGPVLLLAGTGGTVLGGAVANWLNRRGGRLGAMHVTITGMVVSGTLFALAGFADDAWVALAWYAPALMFMTLPGGTAIQVVQEATPNRLRGQATAIYYLTISIVGATLGPLSVGLMTDHVFHDPRAIGAAIGWVGGVLGPFTALLSFSTRRPFLALLDGADANAAAGATPVVATASARG
jgi:MFS family permease